MSPEQWARITRVTARGDGAVGKQRPSSIPRIASASFLPIIRVASPRDRVASSPLSLLLFSSCPAACSASPVPVRTFGRFLLLSVFLFRPSFSIFRLQRGHEGYMHESPPNDVVIESCSPRVPRAPSSHAGVRRRSWLFSSSPNRLSDLPRERPFCRSAQASSK